MNTSVLDILGEMITKEFSPLLVAQLIVTPHDKVLGVLKNPLIPKIAETIMAVGRINSLEKESGKTIGVEALLELIRSEVLSKYGDLIPEAHVASVRFDAKLDGGTWLAVATPLSALTNLTDPGKN